MLFRVGIAVLASACGFEHGKVGGGNNGTIDAPMGMIDAAIDAPVIPLPPDARACYGTFIQICLTAQPPPTYSVDTVATVDTETACTQVVGQNNGPQLCVIAAEQITINAQLHA